MRIAVAPCRETPAAHSLDPEQINADGAGLLEVVESLEAACSRCWQSDAHYICYQIADEPAWPRLPKILAPTVRKAGGTLISSFISMDMDTPDHAPWTDDLAEQFIAGVAKAVAERPVLGMFRVLYPTRNGARVVYELDAPIDVEAAEGYCRGLINLWTSHGVIADPGCADWTRLFRLPFVIRDGVPTWTDELPFEALWQPGVCLNLKDVPYAAPSVSKVAMAEIRPVDAEQPSPDEAFDLLYQVGGAGRRVQTDWYKHAKKRLQGRDCFPCLFEDQPIAPNGSRQTNIQRYVGSAVGLLFNTTDYVTPGHIYALFVPAAEQLEPDQDDPDWMVRVWEAVCRYWAQEDAQHRAAEEVKADAESAMISAQYRMLEGVRTWAAAGVREIRGDDRDAFEWLMHHLIAVSPSGHCHCLKPDGHYDLLAVRKENVRARIRQLGLDTIIPTTVARKVGEGERDLQPQELIDQFGVLVSAIEGVSGQQGSILVGADTESPILRLRLYGRRTDLTPSYHPEVDQWLRLFFGNGYEKAKQWIGHSLAFDEGPIAALSYKGEPGSGKKMFASGLAECMDTGAIADGSEFGQFQEMILRTPFLWINEGWPVMRSVARDRADMFRHMVSGDPLCVRRIYQPTVVLRTPLRLLMTANNLDVVSAVFNHRDMSPEDRQSLIDRIFHISANDDASRWLRLRGGTKFTGSAGNRWIGGDSTGESDYILARHFMWLYESREPPAFGSRFLVTGQMPDDLILSMATRSGRSPLVVETLVKMIESPRFVGIVRKDGRLYTTVQHVLDYWRANFAASSRETLTAKHVGLALDALTKGGGAVMQKVLTMPGGDRVRARWRDLDLPLLLQEAYERGLACSKLEVSADEQDQAKNEKRILRIGKS